MLKPVCVLLVCLLSACSPQGVDSIEHVSLPNRFEVLDGDKPGAKVMLSWPKIDVLDGDTLVVDGKAMKLAGVDAPELGPWAHCWAEAALAGAARLEVQRQLFDYRFHWRVQPVGQDDQGHILAKLTRDDGEDLADQLVVGGFAARTSGRWDWCGKSADLHSPRDGEPTPRGPSLWWPAGDKFDARAAD